MEMKREESQIRKTNFKIGRVDTKTNDETTGITNPHK